MPRRARRRHFVDLGAASIDVASRSVESRIRDAIDDFIGHFILDDRLTVTRAADRVYWDGVLLCADGYEIPDQRDPLDLRFPVELAHVDSRSS